MAQMAHASLYRMQRRSNNAVITSCKLRGSPSTAVNAKLLELRAIVFTFWPPAEGRASEKHMLRLLQLKDKLDENGEGQETCGPKAACISAEMMSLRVLP